MKRKILFFFLVGFSISAIAQEGSVGIGTQTPNEKAVLHLVAPNNDQGFLVPKLTTTQRTSFSGQLTSNENGMMVYDSDLNQFFFWLIDHWEAVGSSLQAGAGIEIVNGVITNTGDPDASDDFSGDWSDLANVPAEFEDGTDNIDDADNDPVNELQDLELSGNILTITGLGSPTQIDLTGYISPNTDEQDLQFAAGQISLSGDPDNTVIDLSTYDTDASDDFSGDWTDLSNVPAAFDDGVDNVDDADSDPTNEIELPATASTNDILVFDGTNWVAGTDQVDDADNDPNNEIELPSSAGLGQVLKYNDAAQWAPGTDLVNDADSDPGNELQDLDLSGNILTITGLGSPTEIDLAPFSGTNTDEQDLQFTAGQIRLTGDPDNTIIDLSNYDTDESDDFSGSFNDLLDVPFYLDTDATDDFSGSFLDLVDVPVNLDVDATDDFTTADELDPTVLASVKDGIDWTELGGIPADISDGDDINDADSDPGNEYQDISVSADRIQLTNSSSFIDVSGWDTNAADDFTTADELDPTVLASVKDGVDWTELGGIPADISDGDDVNDADSDPGNEYQDISVSADRIQLTNSSSFIDVSGWDTNAADDFTTADELDPTVLASVKDGVDWTELGGIPADISDGDDVNDADSDPGNEYQDISVSADRIQLTNSSSFIDVSGWDTNAADDFTTADELDPTVLASVKDGVDWTELGGIPADISDGDDVNDADNNPNNEIQGLVFDGRTGSLRINNDPTAVTVNLLGLRDDADADPNNEYQDIFLNDTRIQLTDSPNATFIDVAGWDRDASDDITTETDPTVPANIKDGITWTEVSGIPDDLLDGDDVNDADFSASNELQTISKTGNTLSLSRGGGSVTILEQVAFNAGKTDRATQSFSATPVRVSFDAESFDLGRNYEPGESFFEAPVDGIYNISGTIGTLVDGGGEVSVFIVVDGTPVYTVIRDVMQQDVVIFSTDLQLSRRNQVTISIRSSNAFGTIVADVRQTNWTGRILLGL